MRSRQRRGSRPKFEAEHGSAYCREHKLCAECGSPLKGRRTRWCSDECVHEYLIRSDPSYARKAVFQRDKGVCAECDLDCDEIRQRVKDADRQAADEYIALRRERGHLISYAPRRPGAKIQSTNPQPGTYAYLVREYRFDVLTEYDMQQWWFRKTFWDADHIIPIYKGGGECGLEGLRTLCVKCHKKHTAKQANARKKRRVKPKLRKPNEYCYHSIGVCKLKSPETLCKGCLRYRCRILSIDFYEEIKRIRKLRESDGEQSARRHKNNR